MFNLLVHGNPAWWEEPPYSMNISRFKEYSGNHADQITATDPGSLSSLSEVPALLMYEVGTAESASGVVRLGRLENITLTGSQLNFEFTPAESGAFLRRDDVLRFREQLGIGRFETHRTHWAIKDGELPEELICLATSSAPVRTAAVVASEYVMRIAAKDAPGAAALLNELAELPAEGYEKAWAMLPALSQENIRPEHYALLQTEPRTAAGRLAVESVLIEHGRHSVDTDPSWPFALASFLDSYGSPTEKRLLEQQIRICRRMLSEFSSRQATIADRTVERISYLMTVCATSRYLQISLRQEINIVLQALLDLRGQDPEWSMWASNGKTYHSDVRATAMALVALQRLGGDQYLGEIDRIVRWLLTQQRADGAFPHVSEGGEQLPDVMATVFALEAIRRSSIAAEVPHVLERGESFLQAVQSPVGKWDAQGWNSAIITTTVLQYLSNSPTILSQVDGFLLMARGFFRKAEDLAWEDGPNSRRLAAIATVHAVEMFLYGVFQQREDLNQSAFRSSGTETLGLRDAMRALQDALQTSQPGVSLKFRDQLSSLVGRRNGIIHGADEIAATQLKAGMAAARGFIDKYSYELLNIDLLQ